MYRSGSDYNKLETLIYSIYSDYNITQLPIDEKEVCQKMGIALVPYSAFGNDCNVLLQKKSKHAFYVRKSKENPPTIYYNDTFASPGAIRLSIFHEIKHCICEDNDDHEDDVAAQTQSRALVECYKSLGAKFPDEAKTFRFDLVVECAECELKESAGEN